jgi:hypothetical protein
VKRDAKVNTSNKIHHELIDTQNMETRNIPSRSLNLHHSDTMLKSNSTLHNNEILHPTSTLSKSDQLSNYTDNLQANVDQTDLVAQLGHELEHKVLKWLSENMLTSLFSVSVRFYFEIFFNIKKVKKPI